MQGKKLFSILSLSALVVLGLNLTTYKTTGSHPGSTGAPLDLTCAQSGCHVDAQVIPNAVTNTTLSFSATDTSYIPGQTYTLTLKAKGLGSNPTTKFGFELVALTDKDSLNAGQFTITETLRTQIINHLQGMDNRASVTHQSSGTPALTTNYSEWTFHWTAPPVNEGAVSFYFAVNCTNDDGNESGDKIYLSSLKVRSPLTSSIKEIAAEYDLKAFYDESKRSIVMHYDLKGKREVQISVFDCIGKLIYSQSSVQQSDKQNQEISLGTNFPGGAYLIQLKIDNQSLSKKISIP